MKDTKRATIYLDPAIHRALRLKAASSDRSVSALVNDAVRLSLAEDAEDLSAFEARADEEVLDFAQFVKELKRSGKI
jgi:plasmid stability protein